MTVRTAVEFLGIIAMAATTLFFAALWWAAFFTDAGVHMTVSTYGEAYLEAGLWFLLAPLMLFGLFSYLKRIPRE